MIINFKIGIGHIDIGVIVRIFLPMIKLEGLTHGLKVETKGLHESLGLASTGTAYFKKSSLL